MLGASGFVFEWVELWLESWLICLEISEFLFGFCGVVLLFGVLFLFGGESEGNVCFGLSPLIKLLLPKFRLAIAVGLTRFEGVWGRLVCCLVSMESIFLFVEGVIEV